MRNCAQPVSRARRRAGARVHPARDRARPSEGADQGRPGGPLRTGRAALPEEEGFGLAAYLVPLLVALLATVGVFAAARRPAPDAAAPHRSDAEDEQRLERELAAYDHGLAGTGAAAAIGTVPALPLDEAGKYVAGGYLVFVALVLVYVAIMAAKLQRLDRDLSELAELEQRRTKRTKEHDGHPDGGAGD